MIYYYDYGGVGVCFQGVSSGPKCEDWWTLEGAGKSFYLFDHQISFLTRGPAVDSGMIWLKWLENKILTLKKKYFFFKLDYPKSLEKYFG